MTTAVERYERPTSDLAITADQSMFTDKQQAALRQLGVTDATNADLAVFFHQSVRTGLDPFARQIYMIGRKAKDGDRWVTKQTIQTGIDGYRLIARRAAARAGETLAYEDTLWCGQDGAWRDVWVADGPPAAAKVTVLRNALPFSAIALWREYVQTDRSGNPNTMWARMSANQLAKCAEAAALRKAFPQDLSGVYVEDEMAHAERGGDGAYSVTSATPARVTAAEILGQPEDESAPTSGLITAPQLKKLHAALNDIGVKDRDTAHAWMSAQTGRDITTAKDLTKDEASRLIDGLENPPPPEDPPFDDQAWLGQEAQS